MPMPGLSRSWFNRLPTLPCSCALCAQTAATVICTGCRQRYFPVRMRRCPRCAIGLFAAPMATPGTEVRPAAVACGACQRDDPAFDASFAVTDYAAPADQLILALKFGGQSALGPWMAAMLRDTLLQLPAQDQRLALPDLLIAVPLSQKRLAERGYNQALEIARPLGRALGLPLLKKLTARTRETVAQTLVAPAQRRINMRRAFMVREQSLCSVRGLHVGVVDDVMTTGATLAEMAAVLKRHGAVRVTNFVFARTMLE